MLGHSLLNDSARTSINGALLLNALETLMDTIDKYRCPLLLESVSFVVLWRGICGVFQNFRLKNYVLALSTQCRQKSGCASKAHLGFPSLVHFSVTRQKGRPYVDPLKLRPLSRYPANKVSFIAPPLAYYYLKICRRHLHNCSLWRNSPCRDRRNNPPCHCR